MPRADLAIAFAGSTVEWAQKELELSAGEVAQTVGANRKTVARWREGESAPSPEHRRHLERLNQLRHFLQTSFRSLEAGRKWLHSPSPGLHGRTPIFALTEGDIDSVLKLLGTLAAGGFR